MARQNLWKAIFVEKVCEMYGFNKPDARFLFEVLMESLVECFDGKSEFKASRIGTFGFRTGVGDSENSIRSRKCFFKPSPEVLYKAAGRDYNTYLEKKRKKK
jgi:hypothetical protein